MSPRGTLGRKSPQKYRYGTVTPAQFKRARNKLGLSANQLAHILGVETRTLRRWEDCDGPSGRPPNPIACRVMEWLLDGYRPPEWPSHG